AIEAELEARKRRPGGLNFRTDDRGIEVQVDGCAINDLGYLIVLVLVEEGIRIQNQLSVQRGIFRTEFEGVVELRLERDRMRQVAGRGDIVGPDEDIRHARRICAAALIAVSK